MENKNDFIDSSVINLFWSLIWILKKSILNLKAFQGQI